MDTRASECAQQILKLHIDFEYLLERTLDLSPKTKTVYFFEPVMLDQRDVPQRIEPEFWDFVHKRLALLGEEELRAEFLGRKFLGAARYESTVGQDYIYIGRMRPGADWPDVTDDAGEIDTLASTGFNLSLVEPSYLVGVSGTNYVAFVRSSAGPSTTAITTWLNLMLGLEATETRLELRPYVRKDQLDRLARAQTATKLHLKIDPDVMTGSSPTDDVGKALKAAQNAGAGAVSVDLTISFGRATPTDGAGEELIDEVRKVLTGSARVPFKKAVANVVLEDENGELIRDTIDFTRDRITVQQTVGADENAEPTPRVVIAALNEAISEFRSSIA